MPVTRPPRRRAARARALRPKRTYARQLSYPTLRDRLRPQRHTVLGLVLLTVAAVLVPTHLAEHAGALDVLPRNREDLFLGFPMAGILGIGGFVALIWR